MANAMWTTLISLPDNETEASTLERVFEVSKKVTIREPDDLFVNKEEHAIRNSSLHKRE